MNKSLFFILALTVGCSVLPAGNSPTELNKDPQNQITSTATPQGAPTLTAPKSTPEDLDDQITGASGEGLSINKESLKPNWEWGPYLWYRISPGQTLKLNYQTNSGGPAFAHVWFFINGKGWVADGWKYNASTQGSYSGTIQIPANALGVYFAFFAPQSGTVSAQLELSSSSGTTTTSNISAQVQNAFNAAKQRAGSQLGSPKSEIVSTAKDSAAQGYKQEFTNGLIVYRNGDSLAYPIYGAFAVKYLAKSGTLDVGFPTGDITKTDQGDGLKQSYTQGRGGDGILIQKNGRTEAFWIHGDILKRYIELGGAFELGYPTNDETPGHQNSVYQMYDGGGTPSLQHYNGNTFLLRAGIRDFWISNFNQLGLPQSDEQEREDGEGVYQKFDKAVVAFSGGKAQIQSYQTTNSPQVGGNFSQPNLSHRAYTTSLNPIIARNGSGFKGQCTWYVSGRLLELGRMPSRLGSSGFVGHAKAWKSYAEGKGLSLSRTPTPGSIAIWTGGTYGHVAFVERVNSNGSFLISESNYVGANTFGTATISTSSRPKLGSLYFVNTPQ